MKIELSILINYILLTEIYNSFNYYFLKKIFYYYKKVAKHH